MTTFKNGLVVRDGKLVWSTEDGKFFPFVMSAEAKELLLQQTKATIESAGKIANDAKKNNSEVFAKFAMSEIPEEWRNVPGVHKATDGKFYTVCVHCGCPTTQSQAKFSIDKWGKVACKPCQDHYAATGKTYSTPEERNNVSVKFHRDCDNHRNCGKQVTGKMVGISLLITGRYALCPTCLWKWSANKNNVKVQKPAAEQEAPLGGSCGIAASLVK